MIRRKRLMVFAFLFFVPAAVGAGGLLVHPAFQPIRLPDSARSSPLPTNVHKVNADEVQMLRGIQDENRHKVAALTASLPHLSLAEREAVEKEVFQIKTDGELAFLRAQVQLAEARGNSNEIAEAKHAMESFTHSLRTDIPAIDPGQPQEKTAPTGGRP